MEPTHPHDARPADLTAAWSAPDYAARLAALRRQMGRLDLGLCLLTAPANQAYFAGFRTIYYPRPVLLAVGRDSTALIVPACEEAEARATAWVDAFVVYHEQPGLTGAASHLECAARALDHLGRATRVGVEMDVCPVELASFVGARGCSLADIGSAALRIREVKAVSELERIAAAASITASAVGASVELMAAGVSELEVDEAGNAAAVSATAALAAATTLELFVITSSGAERTTFPHTLSTTRRLQPGDVVSHSRQVGLGGYRAEIERTLIVGPATTEQRRVFEAMRHAQAAAIEVVRPGARCCDVDRAAREVLAGAGLDAYALHRTGHGLGLATEWPSLRYDNEAPLEEGMVVTIEPGVYLPGLGGFRHSDTLVVTAGGADGLTSFPSELAALTIPVSASAPGR